MDPLELYGQSQEIIRHCDPAGVTSENAAAYIDQLKDQIRGISTWLPPAYGSVAYADQQVIDHLRQIKFHSESALRNFPLGVEALAAGLAQFCQYLSSHYPINPQTF